MRQDCHSPSELSRSVGLDQGVLEAARGRCFRPWRRARSFPVQDDETGKAPPWGCSGPWERLTPPFRSCRRGFNSPSAIPTYQSWRTGKQVPSGNHHGRRRSCARCWRTLFAIRSQAQTKRQSTPSSPRPAPSSAPVRLDLQFPKQSSELSPPHHPRGCLRLRDHDH